MRKKQLACAVALALWSSISSVPRALAHGGEDHAAPAAPSAASTGTERVVSGETEMFSVIVKYPATKADGPLKARLYVARAESSAPVADARVRLDLKGGLTFAADAEKTEAPGVYAITLPAASPGTTANGIVSVDSGDMFDLVLVGDLRFGAIEPKTAPPGMTSRRALPLGGLAAAAGALVGLGGAIGYAVGRRSRRKPPASNQPPGFGAEGAGTLDVQPNSRAVPSEAAS